MGMKKHHAYCGYTAQSLYRLKFRALFSYLFHAADTLPRLTAPFFGASLRSPNESTSFGVETFVSERISPA
jgi:hypothetical protein